MELVTARLRLDALRVEDAPALFAYRADRQVARFQGWQPADLADATDFIGRQAGATLDPPNGWLQRAIRLRAVDELIGDLGIHLPSDPYGSVEFGISIAPSQQGRGYAIEALRAVLALAFDTLGRHRVYASVDPRNHASMAMLRSLGLRQEAHHRQSLWLHGEWVDDVVFALLADEWAALRANDAGASGAPSR